MKTFKLTALPIVLVLLLSNQVNAQKFGKDSVTCINNTNIYHGYVKQESYDRPTIKAWRYCYENCPESYEVLYTDGIKIYKNYIDKNKTDKSAVELYVDTLMGIYDQRIKYFSNEANNLAFKAIDLFRYENHKLESLQEVVDMIKKSTQLNNGVYVNYAVAQIYVNAMAKLTTYDKFDKSELIDEYFKVNDAIDAEIAKNDTYLEKWQKTKEDIDVKMEPFLKCDELLPLYDTKLQGELSKEALSKMVQLMEKKHCEDSETYINAVNQLCALEPSATCKMSLAIIRYKKGDYTRAKTYAEEALPIQANAVEKSKIYVFLADLALKQGVQSTAMSHCKSAIANNPNNGDAYLIMAGIYTSMAANCKDEFDRQAAYWIIVDTYIKAKSVDPSVAEKANSGINKYSQYFPEQASIFFKNLSEGGTYSVPCMDNLTTTIRARK